MSLPQFRLLIRGHGNVLISLERDELHRLATYSHYSVPTELFEHPVTISTDGTGYLTLWANKHTFIGRAIAS